MKNLLKYPWLVVLVTLAITLFFSLQLTQLRLDNDVSNFIPLEHPARDAYQRVEEQFGAQMVLLVGLEVEQGTVFTPQFLKTLKSVTDNIAQVPYVDEITSLMTSDYISGEGGDITTSPLVGPNFQGTTDEINELIAKIQSWDLYENTLVSRNFTAAQILVTVKAAVSTSDDPLTDPKRIVYDGISKVLKDTDLTGVRFYVSGTPAFSILLSRNMQTDLVVLIPLVVLVVVFSLFLSFRRLGGVLLPLITVLISTIWTLGLMGLLGVPLSMLGTIIPVIMIAVGSAYGIHVIQHFFEERGKKDTFTPPEIKEMLAHTLKRVGRPVLLAGLTTLAGFSSLSLTSIVPMQNFGIFSSFGVVAALIVSLTFVPALLLLIPFKRGKVASNTESRGDKQLTRIFLGLTRRRGMSIGLVIAVTLVSLWGLSQLVVDNALVDYFKADTEIAQADGFLRNQFNGSKTLSLVIRGEKPGDLTRPDILVAMDGLARYIETTVPGVSKVVSYTQIIKRINQVFNEGESPSGLPIRENLSPTSSDELPEFGFGFGDLEESTSLGTEEPLEIVEPTVPKSKALASLEVQEIFELISKLEGRDIGLREVKEALGRATNYRGMAYYEIPHDPQRYGLETQDDLKGLIANYLVLVSSASSSWADNGLEPSMARLMVQMNTKGNLATTKVMEAAKEYAKTHFPPGFTLEGAGTALIEKALTDLIVDTQILSILISLGIVFLILTLYYQSFVAGLLGLIPLSLAILINFGIMGLFGIKLDMSTAMIASLAIGIGIDYTIHYLSAYHHERLHSTDLKVVQVKSILSTGKAILFNAVSVGAGFAVLIASQFNPLMYIGLLIALTMATTSLSSMILLPILLDFFKPRFISKKLFFEGETATNQPVSGGNI